MRQHDVLIIGGGPAGSTLAWALQGWGMDVAILDKQAFPRDKVCAGWLNPAVLQSLQIDQQQYQQQNILQPVHGFQIGQLGGRMSRVDYAGAPVSYGIRRCEFDHFLLQRCGAALYTRTKVTSIDHQAGSWLVNGQYQAPLLIGAGGHFCPVARHIGVHVGSGEAVVAAQEIEFAMSASQQAACRVEPERPELYFCKDLKGYGWVVRKQQYLNIGLGREDSHRLGDHVRAFVETLKAQGRIPGDSPDQFHGHAYLLYCRATRPLYQDGVLLIGDAAGMAYAYSGEGIRPAIESALMAAEVIIAARGNYRRAVLQAYAAKLRARLGRRGAAPLLSRGVPQWLKQALAGHLLAWPWFARHMVIDRWFLQRRQPVYAIKPEA